MTGGWQLAIALLFVGGALFVLARRAVRLVKGGGGSAGSCGSSGCQSCPSSGESRGGSDQGFVSLEAILKEREAR